MDKKVTRVTLALRDKELKRRFTTLGFLLESNAQDLLELAINTLYEERIGKNSELAEKLKSIDSFLSNKEI